MKIEDIYRYVSNILEMLDESGYITWWVDGKRLDITLRNKTVASWLNVDGKVRRSLEYVDEPYKSEEDKWYGIFEPTEEVASMQNEQQVFPVKSRGRRRGRK